MSQFLLINHAEHNPLVIALREEGFDVRYVDWRNPLPDLKGCLGFYGNLFDEIKDWSALIRLRNQLRQHQVPYIFWNRDAPWNTGIKLRNLLALKLIKPVDIYLGHSLQDSAWFGGEAHDFPNAAQPGYYQDTDLEALRDEGAYAYDVSYFGSFGHASKNHNARSRAAFLNELQTRLMQKHPGIRFLAVDTSRNSLPLSEQCRLIRTSKINLNFGAMCDVSGNPSWGLPERVFGIPAAGGLVISDHRKQLAEAFSTTLIPQFDSPEACVERVGELLKNFETIRNQAEKQNQHVLEKHTYCHRAQQLLDILYNYRNARKA